MVPVQGVPKKLNGPCTGSPQKIWNLEDDLVTSAKFLKENKIPGFKQICEKTVYLNPNAREQ